MAKFNPQDHYFHKAKKDGYAARSAYKLEEMDKQHRLISAGQRILDLGCSPGSWCQYALKKVTPTGKVVGIDLNPVTINRPANFTFYQGDIMQFNPVELGGPFDVVISDMAPKTSGIKIRDQTLSFELCQKALELTGTHLVRNGHFVMKVFDGPDVEQLIKATRAAFKKVVSSKPDAVRKGSIERYVIALNKF